MSRKGNCWDNAVAESFFGSLKQKEFSSIITKQGKKPEKIFLITLKYFITIKGVILIWVISVQKYMKNYGKWKKQLKKNVRFYLTTSPKA